MAKVVLKTGNRKTSVSRTYVRSVIKANKVNISRIIPASKISGSKQTKVNGRKVK